MELAHSSGDVFEDAIKWIIASNEKIEPKRQAVRAARDWKERLAAIRALYAAHLEIGEEYEDIEPYSLGLHEYWTPIEWKLWQDIRSVGGMQMLPQFPVGPYFIDFANPSLKIGIEADGKEFHDQERDRARDQRLWDDYGWRVFRVSGAETYRIRQSPAEFEREQYEKTGLRPMQHEIEAAALDFFMNTSTGVCRAIRSVLIRQEFDGPLFDMMAMSLNAHRLANFSLFGRNNDA